MSSICLFFSLAKAHPIKVIVLKGLENKFGIILNPAALLTRQKHEAETGQHQSAN